MNALLETVKNTILVKYYMNYLKAMIMKKTKKIKNQNYHYSTDIPVIHYKDLHTIMSYLL